MKKVLLSTVLASLIASGALYAKEAKEASKVLNTTDSKITLINKEAVSHAKANAQAHQQKLVQEAIDSLKLAHKALVDLNAKKSKEATDDIAKALGKLEVILSAEKAPKLLPVDAFVTINEFAGDSKAAKAGVKLAKDLLDHDRIQEARRLLNTLQSEMDITVINLPLSSYPDALKLAAKYLHEQKIEKAKEVLSIALSTFDEVTQVVPLPLVKAIDLATAASKIAKKDKKRALDYLAAAEDQIKTAEALGYVSESTTTYEKLYKMIKGIKKEIKGKNEVEKLFETFLNKLRGFKNKATSSAEKSSK